MWHTFQNFQVPRALSLMNTMIYTKENPTAITRRMFNRYDLKVHPNMDLELQEARMILSTPNANSLDITREKLQDIRTISQDKNGKKSGKEAENMELETPTPFSNHL
ncbi:3715_t:CDS:2 [Ambispora leptoticha]|uniref:3715_t:CDS:1 n=1 Tax=Ambispora leptoticha TaxID=144679 RepID=A0A9N9D1E2_9GLOM|nr:3715_t:CDS:2 [Ambispora leptoticha]